MNTSITTTPTQQLYSLKHLHVFDCIWSHHMDNMDPYGHRMPVHVELYRHLDTAKWTYGGYIELEPMNQRTNGINTLWIPSSDVTRKVSDFLDYTLWIPSIIPYGYPELLDYTWLDTWNSWDIPGWIHRTLGPNTAQWTNETMNQFFDIENIQWIFETNK